jgi:hypothetical protein
MTDRKWLATLGIGIATAAIATAVGNAWAKSVPADPAAIAAKEAGVSEVAPKEGTVLELGAKEAGVLELGKKDGGFTELATEGGGGGWRQN